MKCIQLVNENPVILASRNDYYWVSFVFSKLFALKDKILSLNVGLKSVPKTILGIDISSSAIKLIEMESNHEGYKVVSYGVSPLPPGAVIDREIIDIEATAKVLKIVYQDSNASSLKAAVAVSGTLMSDRGSVIIDERTNTIILTDTSEKIDAFKRMLNQIDIPVKQVLIEARIVRASSDFRRELGVSWGVVGNDAVNFNAISDPNQRLTGVLASDLGIENSPTALSLGYLSNNLLIDLELNALEAGGFGEIVSQPKILTADKTQASIKSGVEIPYQAVTTSSNTADGVVQTQFKEAVLKLQVTPQITPDNRVIMDILVKQDSVGSFTVNAEPAIDITEITTQALVGNGQTLVLGGIFQSEELSDIEEVPILGDIPLLGNLFKKQMRAKDKREILIFITPKIIDENFIDT